MNVTSIANLYSSMLTSGVSSGSNSSSLFQKATDRLDSAQSSTQVQLSAYSKVKSGAASIQEAGQTLEKGSKLSVSETKAALQSLVNAYNETRSAAASTEPGYATTLANNLKRTASSDSVRSDLKSLGITQASDGTLTLDTKKLDAALQADPSAAQDAAARVGGKLESVATKALSSTGGIASRLNALNQSASALEQQQSTLSSLASLYQSSGAYSYSTQSGISSYMSILKL